MEDLLNKLHNCVEFGKTDINSPYPPDRKGQKGALEYTQELLEKGASPTNIMELALIPAMNKVGRKFSENKVFVPQMLLSAKAMNVSVHLLKPYFRTGELKRKGVFIIGTVFGDLHDIGKNLVAMMVEGAGWEVVDLGVDVKPEKFTEALRQHPGAVVGLSALLTTTMVNMKPVVDAIKAESPATKIIVGGAPLSSGYAFSIGADGYGKNPQENVLWLNAIGYAK
ncbi:MAG: corrinoid protein [Dysgonamonadaceae bacterium]|jgi:5-methyltetrahydrofolate--homocysteine methyltransferase|nr:corrinoid protein [Dysgonamonadaceae bacterium]